MDVVVWLRSLGLGKYEAAFRENEIDETVLPGLTAEDLKELGVSALGHRRKLLDAIAALRNDGSGRHQSVTAASARPSAQTPSAAPVAELAGERRHVTVMFCDLVGSTSISAGLDAEEWRDLVSAYLDAASAAVTEMGGHVAKKLGDGLMALFGYPVAQENDAERAARAALSIQRSLADINRKNASSGKPELNARIGVETGPVVIDAAGEIYGDAPNTAARVQALAEPGAVIVTARVQRQVAGLFVAEERGTHELKGVPEPVMLFRLVRASGGGRRAGQRHLTPLIGREEEIDQLMRRWKRARNGDGQLVLIVGEPGLGKSRLIEEFHAELSETPHTWAEFSCSQLLQNTPLHPIADWGRQFRQCRYGRREALGGPGEHIGAGQARPVRECHPPGSAARHSTAGGPRTGFAARGIATPATGGAYQLVDDWRTVSASGDSSGRPPLGRSDHARPFARACRTRCAGTTVCSHHRSAGVSAAVGRPLASQHDLAGATQSRSGAAHGRPACRPPCTAKGIR